MRFISRGEMKDGVERDRIVRGESSTGAAARLVSRSAGLTTEPVERPVCDGPEAVVQMHDLSVRSVLGRDATVARGHNSLGKVRE
jgi:hypothetical protein